MFGFSDLAALCALCGPVLCALCGPNLVPMIATDEETVASSSETHNMVFFTFAPTF
jgi:hypothetical protein